MPFVSKAQQRFTGQYVALTVTPEAKSEGWDASIGSFSTYSGGPRSDDRSYLLLETRLYDLQKGRCIWACLTESTVRETDDRLQLVDEFVAKVVGIMRQDGVVFEKDLGSEARREMGFVTGPLNDTAPIA